MLKYERYDPVVNKTSKNTRDFVLSKLNEKIKRKHKENQENEEQQCKKKQKKNILNEDNEQKKSCLDALEVEFVSDFQKNDTNKLNVECSSQNNQLIENHNQEAEKVPETTETCNNIFGLFSNTMKVASNSKLPLDDHSIHLSNEFKYQLRSRNYTELFPVQKVTIQLILDNPSSCKEDLFIGAPTGSGKTLAYVIPIIQMLLKRKIIRLRCVVILPTKELVSQVRECFEQCIGGSGLKIGISTGQRSFTHEQSRLVGNIKHYFAGGQSLVDILICTPGRLVDHIQNTPNFSLQHLKYLVIDEADRLLSQRFQNWIEIVMNEIEKPKSYKDSNYKLATDLPDAVNDPLKLIFHDDFVVEKKSYITQKLIFSATLTCNPEKVISLRLRNPRLILIEESKSSLSKYFSENKVSIRNDDICKFFVPSALNEYAVLIESDAKPLYLYYLIEIHKMKGVLCFAKSNESAARLFKVLVFIHESLISESSKLIETFELFTNDVSKKQKNIALEKFKNGNIKVFICSDIMARGIDLPQISHVINYDIPQTPRQYIHRVGRTARAGKSGQAWTLYQEFEFKKIQKILKNIGREKEVIYEKISATIFTNEYMISYKSALKKLKQYIKKKTN
ncbi:uncharacterized protein T551_02153 [Pneumocystis jirovecii RU7]|uniref:ATP-dependent RNA helicase n=1 Tax=Pneumocystis jirovecii (strain RU7) TaxID=1408657 RepID=A0A0W4ZMD6_PNEJ7|nr:uncharacterized protein T551_02153 [Pneumocystis jirovecii RU7]KTW29537.1 hypothetical protein T551_02153 [Pneumocystis jirovecii RU7]